MKIHRRHKNKNLLWIIIAIGAAALIGIYVSASFSNNARDEDAARLAVGQFGQQLKNVPLLASQAVLTESLKENYGTLISADLLAEWIAHPSEAPGRTTASPWPEKIRVISMKKISADLYEAKGIVITVTSDTIVRGGDAGEYPVTLELQKINGLWVITNFKTQ